MGRGGEFTDRTNGEFADAGHNSGGLGCWVPEGTKVCCAPVVAALVGLSFPKIHSIP